jgi:glycosyltransferase involved in cell wall biosynthesis
MDGPWPTSVNFESTDPLKLTIVVPTRDEADNIRPLLERLGGAMAPLAAEIVIVDDSTDDTPSAVEAFAKGCPVPVRLLHREVGHRRGGLAGAVLAGIRAARGDWVLVMDADLQHPPETAADVAATAMRHDVDVVVGTRYAGSGSVDGLDGPGRAVSSSAATRLAKALFPRRLATVSDPMSGLFVFRRSAVDVNRLNPIGFKILLEILVRYPGARVAEVAYAMAPRNAGDSKASVRVGLTYLRHLTRLRRQRLIGQLSASPKAKADRLRQLGRMVAFGLVGLSGVGVNTGALWWFYSQLGLHHLLGAALATQASTIWNFALTEGLVYRGRGNGSRFGRALRFFIMNNLLLVARLPVLQGLIDIGLAVLVANAITLVALFLVRFLVRPR